MTVVRRCMLLFVWILAPFQDTGIRTWQLADNRTIEASFKSFAAGQVILRKSDGSESSVPFADLAPDDQKEVMRTTGWGRVWEDDTGRHHTIADLLRVEADSVILEKTNGNRITVKFDRLSKIDRQYAESRRNISAEHLPESFSAKVVGISDGDTITVLINRRQFKIRLDAIDAPEIAQDYGSKSKTFLSDLVGGKVITGKTLGQDKYGRNLCRLFVNNVAVNAEMISNGLAWHYVQYSDDQELAALEAKAKSESKNLWSQSGPISPWEWRKWSGAQRKNWIEQRDIAARPSTTTPDANAIRGPPLESKPSYVRPTVEARPSTTLGYWLNTNSDVRHNAGCRWYHNTKEGRQCGSNEGRACKICGG